MDGKGVSLSITLNMRDTVGYAEAYWGTGLEQRSTQAGSDENAGQERLMALLAGYQDGDKSASRAFVEELNPILFRFYMAQTGNTAGAEDLAQECWIRLHHARSSYRRGEPVLPWVFAIARHTKIDQYRKWKRRASKETAMPESGWEPAADPRLEMEERVVVGRILRELEGMPEEQREVFLMMKVSGMTAKETARAVGSTPGAVKQKAWRVGERLRQVFSQKDSRVEAKTEDGEKR